MIINGVDLDITQRANLRGADLQSADLQSANLRGADLQRADLRSANLWGADLRGADLQRADLRSANLWGADLQRADLRSANLRGANLRGANLQGANLQGANLQGADLPITSHEVISEILRAAASDDVKKRMIAGLVIVSCDWCWADFSEELDKEDFLWALEVLSDWECFSVKIAQYREVAK